jgi:hypothetical protein
LHLDFPGKETVAVYVGMEIDFIKELKLNIFNNNVNKQKNRSKRNRNNPP